MRGHRLDIALACLRRLLQIAGFGGALRLGQQDREMGWQAHAADAPPGSCG
jgi:hypothetical protein